MLKSTNVSDVIAIFLRWKYNGGKNEYLQARKFPFNNWGEKKSIIFYHLREDPEMEVPFKFTNAFYAGLKENGKTNLVLRGWLLCALGARSP